MNNKYENTTSTSTNINQSTSTSTSYIEPCSYRLPCGYCRILMRNCPKYYTTTWVSSNPNITVTC